MSMISTLRIDYAERLKCCNHSRTTPQSFILHPRSPAICDTQLRVDRPKPGEAHVVCFSYRMAMTVTSKEFVEGSLPEGLMKQLLSLASKWEDTIDMKTLTMVPLIAGSLSNKVYRVSWPANADNGVRTVLVRIYGENFDSSFNRDKEIQKFVSISMLGLGPKLLGKSPEGRIEEFIHAKTLSASDLRDPETSALIAAKVREFHNLDMPGSKKPVLWEDLRESLSMARDLCTTEHAQEFRLDTIEEEIGILELALGYDKDTGFCHNDLHYGNIMIDEKTRNITLIDYEYANYNPVAYDIAYHFCAMMVNFHTDTPHILNYSLYPDLDERRRFIQLYLSSAGYQPSDAKVEKLVYDAEKYALASHLMFGLWGIIPFYGSKTDFDTIAYARQWFDHYWLTKPLLLGTVTVIPVNHVNGFARSTT